MNNYIERYIHDVIRRLPEGQRDDVSLELNSLIEDMLEEDDDIASVLRQLGHPKDLAAKYREKPRYLISPEYFDRYIDTLKIVGKVAFVAACIIVSISIISEVIATQFDTMSIVDLIVFLLVLIFGNLWIGVSMIVTSCIFVTVVFAILDYNGTVLDEKEWTLDDLPPVAKPSDKKISQGEVILEVVMSLFFMSMFLVMVINNLNIPVIINGNHTMGVFNLDSLRQYTVLIMICTSLQIIVSVLKLVYNRYNLTLAFSSLISNGASCIVAGFILFNGSIIHTDFQAFLTEIIPEIGIQTILTVIFAIICITSVIDSGKAFYYAYKNSESSRIGFNK